MNEALDTICTAVEILNDVEALLEGAAKLHEAGDRDHAIGLVYIALEKIKLADL